MKQFQTVIIAVVLTLAGNVLAAADVTTTHPALSPVPQQVQWQQGTIDARRLVLKDDGRDADSAAVAQLRTLIASLATSKPAQPLSIIAGQRGQRSVKAYNSRIPCETEGYYLSVSSKGVVVAGNDAAGTFYGVQTLLQLIGDDGTLPAVEITDWPSMPERGVIEGFYGNPYSHESRLRLFDFMGRNKLNVFVYGPKDDPYHRGLWRTDYPLEAARDLTALNEAARRNHVTFVWAIHPGGDIRWTLEDSVALVRKCESVYRLGVRSFCVFFDDIGGEGARGEKQAGLLNYLHREFVGRHKDVAPLMMCPTQYNRSWSHGDYLTTLGTQMEPSVRVMWTGATVVDMIDREDMEWVNAQLRRKAYVWLNYPVTDYCIDHLLMGPTFGNGTDIAPLVSGFCANPMEYCEASKVSLFSIADYTWNPTAYDPQASWLEATARQMPSQTDAFRLFCDNNVDLGPTAHGLRRHEESAGFRQAEGNPGRLAAYFQEMGRAATLLERDSSDPALMAELLPWVKAMSLTASRGMMTLMMERKLADAKPEDFVTLYENYRSTTAEAKALRSRDFRGSIKVASPVVATRHIEPWLRERIAAMVKEYKARFDYRLDVFPQLVLEDGVYLIRDAVGRYLTDPDYSTPGAKAVFRLERDTINPQSQEWTVAYDGTTERYSLTNNQARRYLNEVGAFGTNAYSADWNTYAITRQTADDGSASYAIRNAGNGGDAWWIVLPDDDTIQYARDVATPESVCTWRFEPLSPVLK